MLFKKKFTLRYQKKVQRADVTCLTTIIVIVLFYLGHILLIAKTLLVKTSMKICNKSGSVQQKVQARLSYSNNEMNGKTVKP